MDTPAIDPGDQLDQLAYSTGEAARLIGISRGGLYNLLTAGDLVGRKVGHRTVITRDELIRYLDSRPVFESGRT